MCFRPSSVDMSVMCPGCGKKVSSMGGIVQTNCPFCGADLADAREATAADNLPTAPLDGPGSPPVQAPKPPAAPPPPVK